MAAIVFHTLHARVAFDSMCEGMEEVQADNARGGDPDSVKRHTALRHIIEHSPCIMGESYTIEIADHAAEEAQNVVDNCLDNRHEDPDGDDMVPGECVVIRGECFA